MDQPPPIPDTPSAPTPVVRTMSLGARLLNVFAIPGDVFAEVRNSRTSVGNWLAPALIASVVGMLSVLVTFSQPAIQQQVREKQEQAMDAQVKAGKMTREQADKAAALVEKFSRPSVMMALGSFGATVGSFLRLFWWGLVLWLLGRWFLKAPFAYLKAVEVAGLASMVAILGTIVSLLLIVNLGKMFSTLSLGLAVSDFNPDNKNHVLLGAMNVFSFWHLGLMAAGLGRLAGVPFMRAMFFLLAYWTLMVLLLIFSGLGSAIL